MREVLSCRVLRELQPHGAPGLSAGPSLVEKPTEVSGLEEKGNILKSF